MSEDMKIGRDTKVYSCTVEKEGSYSVTVYKGVPITVEWTYDYNTSELLKKKIESSQPEFESALKVCMLKLLRNKFGDFRLLYNELKTDHKSKYFYDIRTIAEEEYRRVSVKALELEIVLGIEKS